MRRAIAFLVALMAVALVALAATPAGAQCFNCGPNHDLEVSDNYVQPPQLAGDGSLQKVDLRVRNDGPNDAENPVLSFEISSSTVQLRKVVDDVNLTTGSATTLTCNPGTGSVRANCTGAPTIQDGDTHLIHVYLSSTTTQTATVKLTATADQNDTAHGNDFDSLAVSFDASCTSTPSGDLVCGGGNGGEDHTAPAVTSAPPAKPNLGAVVKKGLKVKAGCSEACTLKLSLEVDAKTAKKVGLGKKKLVVGRGKRSLARAGKTTVVVKLTKKAKRKLKRARSLKVTLVTRATDKAGNAAKPKRRKLTLKR